MGYSGSKSQHGEKISASRDGGRCNKKLEINIL
jgi:hypothetical protein